MEHQSGLQELRGSADGHAYAGYHYAIAVAEQLGCQVVDFPSHHAGYVAFPKAFSEKLREVLTEAAQV